MRENINQKHRDSLDRKTQFAVWVTDHVGTVECAIIFSGIGMTSIVGLITNNVLLGIGVGGFSSYFLQLVLLPLIMIKQNIDQKHAELVADEDYKTDVQNDRLIRELHEKVDRVLLSK